MVEKENKFRSLDELCAHAKLPAEAVRLLADAGAARGLQKQLRDYSEATPDEAREMLARAYFEHHPAMQSSGYPELTRGNEAALRRAVEVFGYYPHTLAEAVDITEDEDIRNAFEHAFESAQELNEDEDDDAQFMT